MANKDFQNIAVRRPRRQLIRSVDFKNASGVPLRQHCVSRSTRDANVRRKPVVAGASTRCHVVLFSGGMFCLSIFNHHTTTSRQWQADSNAVITPTIVRPASRRQMQLYHRAAHSVEAQYVILSVCHTCGLCRNRYINIDSTEIAGVRVHWRTGNDGRFLAEHHHPLAGTQFTIPRRV